MDASEQKELGILLNDHKETFEALKHLQKNLQKGLQDIDSRRIAQCQEQERILMRKMMAEREKLAIFLKKWNKLEKGEKDRLLKGKLGKELDNIECIAREIGQSHQSMFPEPRPQPGSVSPQTHGSQRNIADVIHLYR